MPTEFDSSFPPEAVVVSEISHHSLGGRCTVCGRVTQRVCADCAVDGNTIAWLCRDQRCQDLHQGAHT